MQDKTGKPGKPARSSGAAPDVEPQAKPSPQKALASGEPEWTPGPWAAYDRGIGWEVVVPDLRFGTRNLNDGFRETFTKVDAQLVAAAPDLYEALKEAADVICGAGLVEEFPIWVIDLIDAALAKARGEKPESTSTEADEGQEAGARSQDK